MPRGPSCPLALTKEREESSRERERANECTLSLKATQPCRDRPKEQTQRGREGEKDVRDQVEEQKRECEAKAREYGAERRDGECESRVWSL